MLVPGRVIRAQAGFHCQFVLINMFKKLILGIVDCKWPPKAVRAHAWTLNGTLQEKGSWQM